MTGIYKITNIINGKSYIGQSVIIEHRWTSHKSDLSLNIHGNQKLQNAWNKYGEENFQWQVLSICEKNQLNEMELYFINILQPFYNIRGGGDSVHTLSEEHKLKIGASNKGKQTRLGVKLSEETKSKISLAHKSGGFSKGRLPGNAVKVVCLNDNKEFNSIASAAKHYNLNRASVGYVVNGKRNSIYGYKFSYIMV